MISADFAPNEKIDDGLLSLALLLQPWRWHERKEIEIVKKQISSFFSATTNSSPPDATFFLSGRAALWHLLKSLDLKTGDEVIVQGFTCEAVALPILDLSLKPVYVDIEDESFAIDPLDLEKKIAPNTKAVILQHSFGLPPKNREKILALIQKHHLFLIEDLAHGFQNYHFPLADNQALLLSFGRSKSFSSVFGGAIVTANKKINNELAECEKKLTEPSNSLIFRLLLYKPFSVLIKASYDIHVGKIIHHLVNKTKLLLPEISSKEKIGEYDKLLDQSYPAALAILLNHQLAKKTDMEKERENITNIYRRQLNKTLYNTYIGKSRFALLRFPLLVKNSDRLLTLFRKKNIFLGQWYCQPVAPKEIPLPRVGYGQGSCPTAETVCKKIINLPVNISAEEAEKIVKVLNDVV